MTKSAARSADWFWEGNVQDRIVRWLSEDGWHDLHVTDTASREHGVDILARKGDRHLGVEVKGWPSKTYARGPLAGQPNRTQPTTQAANWFSHALLSALKLRQARPDHEVAIGFPDMPRFRHLVAATDEALAFLGIGVLLVSEDGAVEVLVSPSLRVKANP